MVSMVWVLLTTRNDEWGQRKRTYWWVWQLGAVPTNAAETIAIGDTVTGTSVGVGSGINVGNPLFKTKSSLLTTMVRVGSGVVAEAIVPWHPIRAAVGSHPDAARLIRFWFCAQGSV